MNPDPSTPQTVGSDEKPGSLVPAAWDVPAIFRQRLGDKVGRQRAMFADGHLLLILHSPPSADDDDRHGRLFWRAPDGTWKAKSSSNGRRALKEHLAAYRKRLEELEELESGAESADDYFAVLSESNPIYRAARNQHMAMQHARELTVDARDVINFRDQTYEIERAAELMHTDTKNALDFSVARRTEEQAQSSFQMAVSSHRLNVLAAFFFPIATLSSLLGTNLKHGYEELHAPWLFLGMLGVGLLIGLVLKAAITRQSPPA